MDVHEAVAQQRSIRAFLPDPGPRETLTRIFERAQRAPSWCNIQPWRVWIASGETRTALIGDLVAAAGARMPSPDVAFPSDYPEPYLGHRRACAKALYDVMGVARDDGPARHAAWMRNFVAFDAPHVAIVAIDKRFAIWAALDVGCWLETVMLLAEEEGLSTCAQASLSLYPDVLRARLGVGDDVNVLFGLGIGKRDPDAAANRCVTAREALEKNVTFVG
jgi:nitroreductase